MDVESNGSWKGTGGERKKGVMGKLTSFPSFTLGCSIAVCRYIV